MSLSREYSAPLLYIDGDWIGADARESEPVYNPATAQEIGRVPHATSTDLDRAVEAAGRAFPAWAALSADERGKILLRAQALIRERATEIARVATLESVASCTRSSRSGATKRPFSNGSSTPNGSTSVRANVPALESRACANCCHSDAPKTFASSASTIVCSGVGASPSTSKRSATLRATPTASSRTSTSTWLPVSDLE